MAFVGLSRRALRDLKSIQGYSVERWGKSVAVDYIDSIEQGLNRLRENPGLLRTKENISPHFSLYRVREHFLVCTVSANRVYVLTIKHGSMDLPRRLAELEPHLLQEAELLHRALEKKDGTR
jgi:toxin ParE1/3/4